MKQLRDKIVSAIRKNQITNDPSTRVLILSGSHGDGDSGSSGLSDISRLKDPSDNNPGSVTNTFYEGDCLRAGLKPVRLKLNLDNLPLAADQIPDVMKMRKLNPLFFEDTYLTDESISKITFQVINIGHYYQTFGQDCATICLELLAKDFLLSASTDPTHISSQQIFPLHNHYSGSPTHCCAHLALPWNTNENQLQIS